MDLIILSLSFVLHCLILVVKRAHTCLFSEPGIYSNKLFTMSISAQTNTTMFFNFKKFSDLLLADCNQTYPHTDHVEFTPKSSIIIDQNFDPEKLLSRQQLDTIRVIHLNNIKGLDILSHVNNYPINIALAVSLSELNAYSGQHLVNEQECYSLPRTSNTFLSRFTEITFRKVRYPSVVCSIAFGDASANSLTFGDISNSFLHKNRLAFTSHAFKMKSLVTLGLELYRERISTRLMNKYVFGRVRVLQISCSIAEIDANVFNGFEQLKRIHFGIENLRDFFHKGNTWMHGLNAGLNVDLTNRTQVKMSLNKAIQLRFSQTKTYVDYEYWDEDICLFRDYPHSRLVFTLIDMDQSQQAKCTCTVMWIQYYNHLLLLNETRDDYYSHQVWVIQIN